MSGLTMTFLGSGDAFGSGCKLQTCMCVDTGDNKFLIDCGATAMIGIRRFNVEPNDISTIFISHMHGDHYAGIPFFILDAQLVSKRIEPLTIFVPAGCKSQLITGIEALFPGSYGSPKKFDVKIMEMSAGEKCYQGDIEAISYKVNHSGLDARALRITTKGVTIAYSGDTDWQDSLLDCARDADVFVAEAYYYDKKVKFHLDFASLKENVDKIKAKKYILTHMSTDMLNVPKEELVGFELAEDGKVFNIG